MAKFKVTNEKKDDLPVVLIGSLVVGSLLWFGLRSPESDTRINNGVSYIKDNFQAPDGGMYECPQAGMYKEWTDATALCCLCFEYGDPVTYLSDIIKACDWLLTMQRYDVPLFYDYQEGVNKISDLDDACLYRSAWASLALLEGYRLTGNESYYQAAMRLGDYEQDTDGGWRCRYNYAYNLKVLRENAMMLVYFTWFGDRIKAESTLNWILSMENPAGGFNAGQDINMVHEILWTDQNALAIWAIKDAENVFNFGKSSETLSRWYSNYYPRVADKSRAGMISYLNQPDITIPDRYVYIGCEMAHALYKLGKFLERDQTLAWVRTWLNDDFSYGSGQIGVNMEMRANSETHPLAVLEDILRYKVTW